MRIPKVDCSIREAIVAEYVLGGTTYRKLQKRYGYSYAVIGKWVKQYGNFPHVKALAKKAAEEAELSVPQALPTEVQDLQKTG